MRILFLFTIIVTFLGMDLVTGQEKSKTIQTTNERELKIYKGNSQINIFFEYCDGKDTKNCNVQVIVFDLRGIVKILENKNELGEIKIQENGVLVNKENGTSSLVSLAGIQSDFFNTEEFKSTVREVFFR